MVKGRMHEQGSGEIGKQESEWSIQVPGCGPGESFGSNRDLGWGILPGVNVNILSIDA